MNSSSSMLMLLLTLAFSPFAVSQGAGSQPAPAHYRVLYRFKGGADGACPYGSLVRDANGNLYGTTYQGGISNNGTVFKLDTTGKKKVLHRFTGGADGATTFSGLVLDRTGVLYGTTLYGGSVNQFCSIGCGIVFSLKQSQGRWKEKVLYSFPGTDAVNPDSLIRDTAGNLFGTASGGAFNFGAVFRLETTGKETVLYSFQGGPDGSGPTELTRDNAGHLYGTTEEGGVFGCQDGEGCGTVFRLDKAGNEKRLYVFTDGGLDGQKPFTYGGLVRNSSGTSYGTTVLGGASNQGTVFKLHKTGHETVLYNFTGGNDGSEPVAGVVRDSAGNLYGTTIGGGTYGAGTVFKLDNTGKETVLHSFGGGTDGSEPFAGLIRDAAGKLYGNTCYGGNYTGWGTVFEVTP
jgi:uncharacterized repeat protein (TIGR03803 family)